MNKFFKRFFPMPSREMQDRFLEIQAQIREQQEGAMQQIQAQMREQQESVLRQINQSLQAIEDSSGMLRTVLENFEELQKRMDKDASSVLKKFERLSTQLEEAASEILAFYRQETSHTGAQLEEAASEILASCRQETGHISAQLEEAASEIHEIRTGDLLRRIEFLQGKQVMMENTLQRNSLPVDEQRDSMEYNFITRMRALFPVEQVAFDKGFIRIGRAHDGGYLMLDDFENRKVAYSFGIADDVSWDQGMADRGFDVYMYDHTIENLPYVNEKFHYFRIGLGATPDSSRPELKTLWQLMNENHHLDTYGMILKIDIEGTEWDFLNEVEGELLTHFSQIVFEFHHLILPQYEEKIKTAMEKLNQTHQLVHVHPNNYGGYLQIGGKVLPELLEGTYLLRGEYQFSKVKQSFPSAQDEINCVYLPDIYLGNWDT